MTYSSSRRLEEVKGRLLNAITFSNEFTLDSYPPANYYPDTTLDRFNLLQSYMGSLSIALLVLCLILVPKRMHLHSLTLIYVPAQMYITYGLIPSSETDWIQYCTSTLKNAALIGGFSMG